MSKKSNAEINSLFEAYASNSANLKAEYAEKSAIIQADTDSIHQQVANGYKWLAVLVVVLIVIIVLKRLVWN